MVPFLYTLLGAQTSGAVREPVVSGMFYPNSPQSLKKVINSYLSEAESTVEGEIGGLVSPHAGYVYSGPIAAWSYKQILGNQYDVVLVIAPSHFENFMGISVFPGDFYETPLGKIPVDKNISMQLANTDAAIELSNSGHHISIMGRGEHSLEVQLPFLQYVLSEFKLVPVVMADQSWSNVEKLGNGLANVLKNKRFLIVASSDLSHYHGYSNAYELDQPLLDLFDSYAYKEITERCRIHKIEACGYGCIAAMMYACSLLGFNKSKAIKYATSGDVPTGDKSQVVGYMSGVVYR